MTVESQITGADKFGGLQLEFTPSFDIKLTATSGRKTLRKFETSITAGLCVGDEVILAPETSRPLQTVDCRTLGDAMVAAGLRCEFNTVLEISLSEMADDYWIHVKMMGGDEISLRAPPYYTIYNSLQAIATRLGKRPDDLRLHGRNGLPPSGCGA